MLGSWTGLLGDEDLKGHVESAREHGESPGVDKMIEEEARAETYSVAGEGELAFPETLCVCQAWS